MPRLLFPKAPFSNFFCRATLTLLPRTFLLSPAAHSPFAAWHVKGMLQKVGKRSVVIKGRTDSRAENYDFYGRALAAVVVKEIFMERERRRGNIKCFPNRDYPRFRPYGIVTVVIFFPTDGIESNSADSLKIALKRCSKFSGISRHSEDLYGKYVYFLLFSFSLKFALFVKPNTTD